MTNADLEQLIADWYRRLGPEAEQPPARTADCPPLTRLWRQVAQGHPLDEYQDHVGQCDRCRRLSEIIARESHRPPAAVGQPARRPFRRVYAAAGVLAAAACVALLVIPWPEQPPSFEGPVAAFFKQAREGTAAVRGEPDAAPAEPGRPGAQAQQAPPAWIDAARTASGVPEALTTLDVTRGSLLRELGAGTLRLDPDGRLALADSVNPGSKLGQRLRKMIEDDRAACRTIVDALVRHVPGATAEDRASLEQALNQWRAEQVFGGG